MKNIFELDVTNEVIDRINQLNPNSQPEWGKMSVAQMLAHSCVSYEMVYDDIHPKASGVKKFLLKLFVKKAVVGPKPYPKNSRTAPEFLIKDKRNFTSEKERLISYLKKAQEDGESFYDLKESNSFGKLTVDEWSTLFYKHIDHHLRQFNV